MTRIVWDKTKQYHEYGVEKVILYLHPDAVIPWSGVVSIEENTKPPAFSPLYFDGSVVNFSQQTNEFRATLTSYTYPTELEDYVVSTFEDSTRFTTPTKRFPAHLCYRSRSAQGDKIHFIFNCILVPKAREYVTVADSVEVYQYTFEIVALPATYGIADYPKSTATYSVRNAAFLPPPPGADPSAWADYLKNRYIDENPGFPEFPDFDIILDPNLPNFDDPFWDNPAFDHLFPTPNYTIDVPGIGDIGIPGIGIPDLTPPDLTLGEVDDFLLGTPTSDPTFISPVGVLDLALGTGLSGPLDPATDPAIDWNFGAKAFNKDFGPGFVVYRFDETSSESDLEANGSYISPDGPQTDLSVFRISDVFPEEIGVPGEAPLTGVPDSIHSNSGYVGWRSGGGFRPSRYGGFDPGQPNVWLANDAAVCEVYFTTIFANKQGNDSEGGTYVALGSSEGSVDGGWLRIYSGYGDTFVVDLPDVSWSSSLIGFYFHYNDPSSILGDHVDEPVVTRVRVTLTSLSVEFFTTSGERITGGTVQRTSPNQQSYTWGDWLADSDDAVSGEAVININSFYAIGDHRLDTVAIYYYGWETYS